MEMKKVLLVVASVATAVILMGMLCSLFGVLLKWAVILLLIGGLIWLTGYFVFDVNLVDYVKGIFDGWKNKPSE